MFGPERQPGETHALAAALAEMGLARDGADYLWTPRVGPRTRALDRTLLDAYGEAKPRGRLAGAVRRHSVPMHLRQYNTDVSGRRPSQEKRRTYAEARRQFRMWHVLPEQLPPDCTWVEPYGWGASLPKPPPQSVQGRSNSLPTRSPP